MAHMKRLICYKFSILIFLLSLAFTVFTSCNNQGQDTTEGESPTVGTITIAKELSDFYNSTLSGIDYEQIKKDNNFNRWPASCKIGDYIIFTDLGYYSPKKNHESHLILMKKDATDRQVVYTNPKIITSVQIVDKSKIAFAVVKIAELDDVFCDYYYLDLKTGQIEAFAENPENAPNPDFNKPVWVDGNMFFEMYTYDPNDQSISVTGKYSNLYCKNTKGEYILLTKKLSHYYINNDTVYFIDENNEYYSACNLDGSNIRKTEIKRDQRIVGEYLVDLSDENYIYVNDKTGNEMQIQLSLKDKHFVNWSETHGYININQKLYRISLADGEKEQVADTYAEEVDIYSDFIIYRKNIYNSSDNDFENVPYITYFGIIESQRLR